MKKLALLAALLSAPTFAEVQCYYRFTDSTITITPQMKVNACTADFIWGADNVCFTGSAKSLAKEINKGTYSWESSGLSVREAEVLDKDSVHYKGVDAQSFFASTRTIYRCQ